MKKQYLLLFGTLSLLLFFSACNVSGPKLFGEKNLHQSYGKKLTNAGLAETSVGKKWFAAAEKALVSPVTISIPYKERGYFPAENPLAYALQFEAARGKKLQFKLTKSPKASFLIFVDLYKLNDGGDKKLIASIDTATYTLTHEVEEDSKYVLRLQPELLQSGEYELSISTGPSMAFPVSGNKGRVGSVWGDARDAGARSHEGIDLFAPANTPAIAAANGVVTAVNENNLGGKVVWLRPEGKYLSLYYAHLNKQLVTAGQRVKVGDTLGLIGNTGNAKTTPPHLHFGIYNNGGAINPLPFVDPKVQEPSETKGFKKVFNEAYTLGRSISVKRADSTIRLAENTVVKPMAVTNRELRLYLPDSVIIHVPADISLHEIKPIKQAQVKSSIKLVDAPAVAASTKSVLAKNDQVNVLGYFNEYAFVQKDTTNGWIPKDVF